MDANGIVRVRATLPSSTETRFRARSRLGLLVRITSNRTQSGASAYGSLKFELRIANRWTVPKVGSTTPVRPTLTRTPVFLIIPACSGTRSKWIKKSAKDVRLETFKRGRSNGLLGREAKVRCLEGGQLPFATLLRRSTRRNTSVAERRRPRRTAEIGAGARVSRETRQSDAAPATQGLRLPAGPRKSPRHSSLNP